ncbi:MAG: hypothetical protein WC475_03365 [Candidatus Paceibacterota bacterium]
MMHHTYQNTRGTKAEIKSYLFSANLDYIDYIYGTKNPEEAFKILSEAVKTEKGLCRKIKESSKN